jgi:hypothetical protein
MTIMSFWDLILCILTGRDLRLRETKHLYEDDSIIRVP